MKKEYVETKAETNLVTDLEGIQPIKNILKRRQKLFIEYPNLELQISKKSIEKICHMANIFPEESILFAFRTRSTMPNYEDEDSFIQSYRNRPQVQNIIDTDDIIVPLKLKENDNDNENENDDNNLQQTLANSGDLEQGVIESMKNKTFFDEHIHFFIITWELSYLTLLLSGVVMLCHLSFFVYLQTIMSLYMLCGISINFLLFYIGFLGMYYIKIAKVQKINETWQNVFLIVLVILTLIILILAEYGITVPVQTYLEKQTLFRYLYYWLLINESICLLLNFKMNQFYVEYNFLLPLKYPFLKSRSQRDIEDEYEF